MRFLGVPLSQILWFFNKGSLSPSVLSWCVPFCHYDEISQQINSKETWFILVSHCEHFYPIILAHRGIRAWRADLFCLPITRKKSGSGWSREMCCLQSHITSDLFSPRRLHTGFHHLQTMLSNYEAISGLIYWLGQRHHDPITFPWEPVGQTFHFQILTPVL